MSRGSVGERHGVAGCGGGAGDAWGRPRGSGGVDNLTFYLSLGITVVVVVILQGLDLKYSPSSPRFVPFVTGALTTASAIFSTVSGAYNTWKNLPVVGPAADSATSAEGLLHGVGLMAFGVGLNVAHRKWGMPIAPLAPAPTPTPTPTPTPAPTSTEQQA